jgi:hypothetical protein
MANLRQSSVDRSTPRHCKYSGRQYEITHFGLRIFRCHLQGAAPVPTVSIVIGGVLVCNP